MVLEATLVCLDNSEWMRNGDYVPSRFEAQNDAVNLLCGVKIDQNPENTVGVMTMAGKNPEVLVTPTQDIGKILSSLVTVKIAGEANILSAIQIAQLCLKHRQNKHQKQRIIVFIGSPISCEASKLVQLGKKLKKNNVAVDVVNFGEPSDNAEKLEQFIAAVNSQDNSRLVTVPPGPHIMSDMLITSPLLLEDGGIGGGGGGDMGGGLPATATGGGSTATGNTGRFEFGVDPNLDPELALALRISMEEERARQAEAEKQQTQAAVSESSSSTSNTNNNATSSAAVVQNTEDLDLYDDELLQQAMAMSMQQPAAAATSSVAQQQQQQKQDTEMGEAGEEDEDLKLALAMSMQQEQQQQQQQQAASSSSQQQQQQQKSDTEMVDASATTADVQQAIHSADFLNDVLSSLPGVDPSDPRLREMLKKDEEKKK